MAVLVYSQTQKYGSDVSESFCTAGLQDLTILFIDFVYIGSRQCNTVTNWLRLRWEVRLVFVEILCCTGKRRLDTLDI